MHQITNSIFDEESSKFDNISSYYFKISQNLSEFLPTENPKQAETNSQENYFRKNLSTYSAKKKS